MDPLSVIASIIAVLQLSTKVTHYVVAAEGATKQRMRLHEEIRGCEVMLFRLKIALDSPDSPDRPSTNLLEGPCSPFRRLEKLFASLSIKLAPKKGLGKVMSSLAWPFNDREVGDLIAAVQREKDLLHLALTESSRDLLQEFMRTAKDNHFRLIKLMEALNLQSDRHGIQLEKLNTTLEALHVRHEILSDNLETAQAASQRLKILDWIIPTDHTSEQENYIDWCQPGTGQWLLQSAQFKSWVAGESQTLYCPGIPGAGKTILASIVVHHLQTKHLAENVGVAYVYCDFRRRSEQTPRNLLATLLRQAVQGRPEIDKRLADLYEAKELGRATICNETLMQALESSISSYSRLFVVVDAVDELDTSQGYRDGFLTSLATIRAKVGRKMSLFTTSRAIPEVAEKFRDSSVLEILATEADILSFTQAQMSRLPSFVRSRTDLQAEIIAAIVKAAQGMFLMARLHLESLVGSISPKAIRAALTQLPTGPDGYDFAYRNTMNRIDSGKPQGQRDLAYQVLEWLTRAKSALTLSELRHAIAVEVDSIENVLDPDNLPQADDIISACAGLATVDKATGVVRLVHYTAQDFFERTQADWFPRSEKLMAETCLKYLKFEELSGSCKSDDEYEARLKTHPLYRYAAQNWGHHVLNSEQDISVETVLELLEDSGRVGSISQALFPQGREPTRNVPHVGYSQLFPRGVQGLHLAAYFNLNQVLNRLLACHDAGICDENDVSALAWAAVRGHVGVAKTLLENQATVDKRDDYGFTPLILAARNGRTEMVDFLLGQGASIEAVDLHGRTPLSWAAGEGHAQAIATLLANGASTKSLDERKRSPLSWGARHGFNAVVKLLIDAGARADQVDDTGRTPLSWAVEHFEVVEYLISMRPQVNIDAGDRYRRTPLSYAASGGYEATAKLLLKHGSNFNMRDTRGRTALLWAVRKGNEQIASLFLEHGCNVGITDDQGFNVLSLAHHYGYSNLYSILVNNRALWTSTRVATSGLQIKGEEEMLPRSVRFLPKPNVGDVSPNDALASSTDRGYAFRRNAKVIDIRGTAGTHEMMDPRYRKHARSDFERGKVFRIMYHDSSDAQERDGATVSTQSRIHNQYGESHSHFQNFLVFSNTRPRYSHCLRISTYKRQACRAKGIDPAVHGIAFQTGSLPSLLQNEPELGFQPIEVKLHEQGEVIKKEARINYSKTHTIAYSVKAHFIGYVIPENWKIVEDAFRESRWRSLVRAPKRRSRVKASGRRPLVKAPRRRPRVGAPKIG